MTSPDLCILYSLQFSLSRKSSLMQHDNLWLNFIKGLNPVVLQASNFNVQQLIQVWKIPNKNSLSLSLKYGFEQISVIKEFDQINLSDLILARQSDIKFNPTYRILILTFRKEFLSLNLIKFQLLSSFRKLIKRAPRQNRLNHPKRLIILNYVSKNPQNITVSYIQQTIIFQNYLSFKLKFHKNKRPHQRIAQKGQNRVHETCQGKKIISFFVLSFRT